MPEHKIAAQRIFDSFRYFLATMENSSLLKDQNPSLLWLNVYEIIFFTSSVRINACSTTFHFFVAQIDLDSDAGLSSIGELELAVTMASEVMPRSVPQETEAFIQTVDVFIC